MSRNYKKRECTAEEIAVAAKYCSISSELNYLELIIDACETVIDIREKRYPSYIKDMPYSYILDWENKRKANLREANFYLRIFPNYGHRVPTFDEKTDTSYARSWIEWCKKQLPLLKAQREPLRPYFDDWPSKIPPDCHQRRMDLIHRSHSVCERCGSSGGYDDLVVHHRQPFSEGGNHHLDNLEYICVECHSLAHTKRPQLLKKAKARQRRRIRKYTNRGNG